ncbi:MAG TPA: hypothetical protein VI386_17710 [Candidatus Sulfotelmatobacter sp.]
MKFTEIKDENGTALQTYAEMLQSKARDAGLVAIFVFAAKDGPHQGIHCISSVAGDPARILGRLAAEMRDPEDERQLITPVSAGQAN